ncbi:hypothetical protein [Alistipes sp.]|uniref:hypothetical protein n=1 Tax=Alistipes sp. TaxID=1872444 RepID=UPI003AEF16D3
MANETNTGWVRLYRSTLEWEWFDDPLTLQLWVVCLLRANWVPTRWQGVEIERGSFVTSVGRLCAETGQSARQIRTRLTRLQASGEIAIRATNQKSIITLCKFDTYQPVENTGDKRPTNSYAVLQGVSIEKVAKIDERNDEPNAVAINSKSGYCNGGHGKGDEPGDNRPTNDRQTQLFSSDNSIRIYKENKELKESLSSRARATETERETFFEIFFFKNFQKPDQEVERFCANYEASGWVRKNGQIVVDRAALARTWTQEDPKAAPRFADGFLKKWRILYNDARSKAPASARLIIHGLRGVAIHPNSLTLICSPELSGLIDQYWQSYFVRFFDKYFNGLSINKRTMQP